MTVLTCSKRPYCARWKNEEKMEKYAITWQHNYHRASIHLAMYGLYDF